MHRLNMYWDLGTVDMIIVGFELPEQIDNYIGRIKKVANHSDKKINRKGRNSFYIKVA